MATYTLNYEELGNNDVIERLKLDELHIYGSSRLGLIQDDAVLYQRNMTVNSYDLGWITNYTAYNVQTLQLGPADEKSQYRGFKRYELSNHLGNVLAVITDRKMGHNNSGTIDYFEVEYMSFTDYYPFGMTIQARSYTSSGYRYSFNRKETDDETRNQDYGFRIYNPRTGRFLSEDPLTTEYPWYTPYQFAGNKPIWAIDLDGLEDKEVTHYFDNVYGDHKTIIKVINPRGPEGYGTLHKYIKKDWIFDKKRVVGNMTYYDYKIKEYEYKKAVFVATPLINIVGDKMNATYNSIYRAGRQAESGGVGVQGKGQLGIFAFSGKFELYGNDEYSGGLNIQFDFGLVGSIKVKDVGVTSSIYDWGKIGFTGQAYAFLNSEALSKTTLKGAGSNANYFESSPKLLLGGMGFGGTYSQNLTSQSKQYRVGPVLDASLDLSKGLMRSGKSSADVQLIKKFSWRFTSGQVSTGK